MDSDIDIDLSQFHEVFFEECAEGVAVMEAELLGLDVVEPDIKVIDTIFRAVHSIKGSAGTFGFPEISAFTHGMETVLDAMRAAKLQTSQQIVSTLLASVDCLREMIDCSQNSKPFDDAIAKELTVELEQIIASPVAQTTVADHSADKEQAQTTDGSVAEDKWHISFYPNQNLFLPVMIPIG